MPGNPPGPTAPPTAAQPSAAQPSAAQPTAEASAQLHNFCLMADLAGVDLVVQEAVGGRFIACNHSAHERLGYSEAELLNLSPTQLQADPEHDGAWDGAERSRHRCSDGTVLEVALQRTSAVLDGRPVILTAISDCTAAHRWEHQLRDTLHLLHEGEAASGIGSWEVRFCDGRMRWSEQTHRICKSDPAGAPASLWSYGTLVHRDDRPRWRREFQRAVDRGEPLRSRHRLAFLDGSTTTVVATGQVSYDEHGNPERMVGTLRDGSVELSSQEELERARLRDPLTGLPNKLATQEELERRLHGRGYNTTLAVLSLDVDGFQEINDNFGSEVGDQVLQAIAIRLAEQLGPQAWLARVSSDQFLVLLEEGIQSLGDAMATGRRLLLRWANQAALIRDLELCPSFCIGLATYPEHAQTSPLLLQCANTALSEAKRSGRSHLCAYSTALSRQIHERMQLSSELAQAIDREQLRLVVQPQLHANGSLTGGEVLLRWTNRRGQQVPPSQFIPLAEESGMIHHLSAWALGQMLHQMRQWSDRGLPLPRLAINVSPRQLEVPGRRFVGALLEALANHQLSPELVELEITETALMRNPAQAREQLRVLAEQGFRIAIDDFGTGYSSLELLRNLPVHKLKIDRTFVQMLTASPQDQAIVQATITLAQGLGMACIAEGVETDEQRQRLEELGCELFQGYLFSRPLELEAFGELLRDQQLRDQQLSDQQLTPQPCTPGPVMAPGARPRSQAPSTLEQLELLHAAIDSAETNMLLLRGIDGPAGGVIDYVILEANRAACMYMRLEREAVVGQRLLGIFPGMGANGLFELFADASIRGTPAAIDDFVYCDHELLQADRIYTIQINPVRDFLSVSWRDVTERHHATRSLAESAALYRLLAENIVEVVVLADAQEQIRWVSPSLEPMTGWQAAQWQERRFAELFATATGVPTPVDLEHWLHDYGDIRQGRLRLAHPERGWNWVDLSVRRLNGQGLRGLDREAPSLESGYVITLEPVDEQVLRERHLLRQASTDPLTGSESRGSILAWLNRRLEPERTASSQPLALLFCDCDNFKGINDTYGHAAGDAVLKAIAERLQRTVRSHDRVGRLGGDEFLVVLDGVRSLGHGLRVAEKLRTAIAAPIPWGEGTIGASLSMGVAMHAAGEDADLFIQRADRAMYAAKTSGRHRGIAAC